MSQLVKQAAAPKVDPKQVMSIWKYLTGAGIGAVSAAESGAALRGEKNIVNGLGDAAILRIAEDAHVRRDALWGGALGSAGAAARGPKWSGVVQGGIAGAGVEVIGMNFANNQIRANDIALQQAKNQEKEIDSNNIQSAVLGILGAGALGLGGYALYKYLSSKKEEKAAPPKVKVRIKGSDRDPYDDATVEVPLHNLKVTQNLEQGVNRSMRRVLRENNKFSGKKKDPITGKLISYQEYVDKYGDPDTKKNKKKFNPDPTITSDISSTNTYPVNPITANSTIDKESDTINPITSYNQINESI